MLKRCVFKSHRKAAFESVCLIDYSQCLVRRLKKRVDRTEFWFEGQRRTWPPMTVVDDAVGSIFIMFVCFRFLREFLLRNKRPYSFHILRDKFNFMQCSECFCSKNYKRSNASEWTGIFWHTL